MSSVSVTPCGIKGHMFEDLRVPPLSHRESPQRAEKSHIEGEMGIWNMFPSS